MASSIANQSSLVFQPNEAVEKGLVRVLKQLASCAASTAQNSGEKLSNSVHDTRVLVKRLRALLWFAQSAFSSSEMTRAKLSLQKASHLLATQRDLLVTRSILQMLSRKTSNLRYRKTLVRLSRNSNGTKTANRKTIQTLRLVAAILRKTIKEIMERVKIQSQWPATSDRMISKT